MKSFLVLVFGLLLSSGAFADQLECPAEVNPQGLDSAVQWVRGADTCKSAVERATACAQWGSSADEQIIYPAAVTCRKELDTKKPTEEELAALDLLQNLCTQKYPRDAGSMWAAARNFCYLRQITNLLDLKTSLDEELEGLANPR